jgi:putative FmdB family regulatory protein
MPLYEYWCEDCGDFTAMRRLAEFAEPHPCPDCGTPAPRALITAPRVSGMAPERKAAFAINERSAHEPQSKEAYLAKKQHGAGCSCCTPGLPKRATAKGADGSKAFPTARPWMISH